MVADFHYTEGHKMRGRNVNSKRTFLSPRNLSVLIIIVAVLSISGREFYSVYVQKKAMKKAMEIKEAKKDRRKLKKLTVEENNQDDIKKFIFEFGQSEQAELKNIDTEEYFDLRFGKPSLLKKGGNILRGSMHQYNKDGEEVDTAEYVSAYDEQGKLQSKDYIHKGFQSHAEYEYNDEDHTIKQVYDDGGYTEYEYDQKGNLIKVTTSAKDITTRVEYKYDAYGNMVDETAWNPTGILSYAREYEYAPGTDVKLAEISYGMDRCFLSRTEYIYDSSGKLIRETNQDGDSYVKYDYDDTGNLLKEAVFKDGKEISRREYEHDENDLVTKETYYNQNSDGNVSSGSYGYEYDDTGDLITETYFDEDGTIITKLKFQYEYYDE